MPNTRKLHKELVDAGIQTSGCDSEGIVWGVIQDKDTGLFDEIQDHPDVKAVIAAHDPTPIPVETLEEKIIRIVDQKLNIVEGK